MQLLRRLLAVIYTTDIARAQESPNRTKVLAAVYSKPLKKKGNQETKKTREENQT